MKMSIKLMRLYFVLLDEINSLNCLVTEVTRSRIIHIQLFTILIIAIWYTAQLFGQVFDHLVYQYSEERLTETKNRLCLNSSLRWCLLRRSFHFMFTCSFPRLLKSTICNTLKAPFPFLFQRHWYSHLRNSSSVIIKQRTTVNKRKHWSKQTDFRGYQSWLFRLI